MSFAELFTVTERDSPVILHAPHGGRIIPGRFCRASPQSYDTATPKTCSRGLRGLTSNERHSGPPCGLPRIERVVMNAGLIHSTLWPCRIDHRVAP
jgi:hypothetical protein